MSYELEPLPPDLAELLAAERSAPGLSAEARGRLRAQLAMLPPILPGGGGDGGGGGGGGGGAGAGAAAAKSAVVAKGLAIVAALGVAAIGGAAVQARYAPIPVAANATTSPPSAIVAPATVSASSAPPSLEPAATDVHALPSSPAPGASPSTVAARPATSASGATDDRLRKERASLEVARMALTRGDYDSATSALDRHAREFPRGQLAEERESMRVQALVGQRRYDDARAAAAKFRRDFPGSMLEGVVDSAIRSIP